MKISFKPRTGQELSELDPVALAAQVDVLQVLLIAFITSFDEDIMPGAIRDTLNTMNVTATVVPQEGDLTSDAAAGIKDRYLESIGNTLDRIRELVS